MEAHQRHGWPRAAAPPHVLIIVQNLPVPLDRRVWLECQALAAAGYDVSVICPKGPGDPARAGDRRRPHLQVPAGPAGRRAALGLRRRVRLLLAADGAAVAARVARRAASTSCRPATRRTPTGCWPGSGGRAACGSSSTSTTSTPSCSSPASASPTGRGAAAQLRRAALARADDLPDRRPRHLDQRVLPAGSRSSAAAATAEDVTVVRSGPDTRRCGRSTRPPRAAPRERHTLVYLGIMGPQDGVDLVLDVMDELVHRARPRRRARRRCSASATASRTSARQAPRLGLDDVVTFTGRADKAMIADHLSAADVGLCPDLQDAAQRRLDDEQDDGVHGLRAAVGLLRPGRDPGLRRRLRASTSPSGDVEAFADAVERLLDDPELRVEMAARARARVGRRARLAAAGGGVRRRLRPAAPAGPRPRWRSRPTTAWATSTSTSTTASSSLRPGAGDRVAEPQPEQALGRLRSACGSRSSAAATSARCTPRAWPCWATT